MTTRRAGIALSEVLIAIFVLALGLLGIATLFVVGALQSAQAIKDERTAATNYNAAAQARQMWKDALAVSSYRRDPFLNAFRNPNASLNPDYTPYPSYGLREIPPSYMSGLPQLPPTYTGPSYPVFVDPVGWNNFANISADPAMRYWIAGSTQVGGSPQRILGIPRRSLRFLEYSQDNRGLYTQIMSPATRQILTSRFFIQLDDLAFGPDGTPVGPNSNTSGQSGPLTGEIQRDGRYSFAYFMKLNSARLPSMINLTVVVYSGRSPDGPSDETAYAAGFTPGSTSVLLRYDPSTQRKPAIRKGQWILDSTMHMMDTNGTPDPHGHFYRVVDITEVSATDIRLEIHTPALGSPQRLPTFVSGNPANAPIGFLVVMDHVSEVFDNGTITPETPPVP
jgi:hypothetical protein